MSLTGPNLSPEERAEDLLGRLTLKEKVTLMQNESFPIERLGIAHYDWWNEALHGVARAGIATVFPITMGMASSFDDKAIEDIFTAVSDEVRAKYHDAHRQGRRGVRCEGLTFWTPNINIFRDPRWGRGQETYGEDPYLTSRMGVAVVKGLQGPADAKYDKLTLVPSTMQCIAGRKLNATLSMLRIFLPVICGKPIYRLLKHWYKKLM